MDSSSAPTRTLYDLFGVDRWATGRQIRAAYLDLIKQHHPDLSADPSSRAELSQLVADLNVAFETLGDPDKRARYDRQLATGRAAGQVTASGVEAPSMAPLSMRPRRYPTLATAALVFLISILSIEIADPMLVKRILAINGYEIALANLPNRGGPNVLVVDEPDIQREVAAATAVSIDQAVNISEECFQDALESPKPQITAKCIIFDNAVLIWASRSEDDGTIPIYFRIERSRARYLDALSRWDADNDAVLAQLRAAPLRAMLTQIRSTQPVARSFETQQRVQEAAAVLDRPTGVPEVENPILGRSKIRASQLTKNKLNTAAQEIDQ